MISATRSRIAASSARCACVAAVSLSNDRYSASVARSLRSGLERIESRWIEGHYWDRAAPAMFGLFMIGLIVLLVLSYTGVPIV